MQGGHIQGNHVFVQLGSPGAELVPKVISLSVIVDEDARVDAADVPDLPSVPVRAGGRIGHRNPLGPFRQVVIQVILPVLFGNVRRIQVGIAVRNLVIRSLRCEDIGMEGPMQGILRGQHVMVGRTPEIRRQVQGTGHIQFSVDDLGAGVRHVHAHRADGIVAELAGHERIAAFVVLDNRFREFRFWGAGGQDGQAGQQGCGKSIHRASVGKTKILDRKRRLGSH